MTLHFQKPVLLDEGGVSTYDQGSHDHFDLVVALSSRLLDLPREGRESDSEEAVEDGIEKGRVVVGQEDRGVH